MRNGIIIAALAAALASPGYAQQIFKCVENGTLSGLTCGE